MDKYQQPFGLLNEDEDEAPAPAKKVEAPPQASPASNTEKANKEGERYLVFTLGGTQYATPLLAAREVIEVPNYRTIPHTKDYFLGISNLRGEVVGLIDLRKMLSLECHEGEKNSVIIYESSSGPLGALIDEITGVINLLEKDISVDVSIKTSVPQKYLRGIGRLPDDELVVVLDLQHVLEEDDLVVLRTDHAS